jgi:hypothetical protein
MRWLGTVRFSYGLMLRLLFFWHQLLLKRVKTIDSILLDSLL